MFEYRVTKYDSAYRDHRGAYMRDEWTSVSDIGRSFCGVELTELEYQRVEDSYVAIAVEFMREAGMASLTIAGLQNHAGIPLSIAEGSALGLGDVGAVIRRVLREEFWCRLETDAAFLHFGHDYYMYVGVVTPCPTAELLARKLGLFIEPFRSPYSSR